MKTVKIRVFFKAVCFLIFISVISGCGNRLVIRENSVNPWTRLKSDNKGDNFSFVIVADRSGGIRRGVFRDAVEKINLLDPEFVLSVGDFITGYTEKRDVIEKQWAQFDSIVEECEPPFFYLPGNHDLSNDVMKDIWKKRYGSSYYHFKYNDILFLCLNSEDISGGGISEGQAEYFKRVINDNKDARWTFLFLHRPLWLENTAENGWEKIEKKLNKRNYTVFSGHMHSYSMRKRNGMRYFILGTTGGAPGRNNPGCIMSHIVWVSVKNGKPGFLNLTLEGMIKADFCGEK